MSVSDRIIDTVHRAFEKHYRYGESPEDIWIVFLEVPATEHGRLAQVHAARLLAEDCGLSKPGKFRYEMVFEWAIPEEYVLHRVSLQTLMARGLEKHCPARSGHQLLSTFKLRCRIASDLQSAHPWDMGLHLAFLARTFGARAPFDWIAHQLFFDCVWQEGIWGDGVVRRLRFAQGDFEIDDSEFFQHLEDGIDTGLIDWWLLDTGFIEEYHEFELFRGLMVDRMVDDHIYLQENWPGAVVDLARHEEIHAAIEAEATRIGL